MWACAIVDALGRCWFLLLATLSVGFLLVFVPQGREALWAASRVDEDWQQDLWGVDEEAAELAAVKARAFLDAARFFDLRHAG